MASYPANLGIAHFHGGSFRPSGPVRQHGRTNQLGAIAWRASETIAARIFVGFNVGDVPTWTIDNLIELVLRMRQLQGANPSATMLAQKGIYQHTGGDRHVVVEDGAQVIIFNEGKPSAEFTEEMVTLGTEIAKVFQQELVIVEIQRNGVTQETIGVTP